MKVFNSFQEVLAVSNFYGQDIPTSNPSVVQEIGVSIRADIMSAKLSGSPRERESWIKLKRDAVDLIGDFKRGGEDKNWEAHHFSFNTGTGQLAIEGMPPVQLSKNPIDAAMEECEKSNPRPIEAAEKVIWDYVNANLDKIEWKGRQ